MAVSLVNNLYPPIIDTYMPAFIRDKGCRIYFALSQYNSKEDISNVQVTVVNQNTNISALSTLHPTGIKLSTLYEDPTRNGDDRYYITLYPDDMENKSFELNQFYKVQLRFTHKSVTPPEGASKGIDAQPVVNSSWLVSNQGYFSEWSTVCLIKGITQPSIYIRGFEQGIQDEEVALTTNDVAIVGKLYYGNKNTPNVEKEFLKQYVLKLYDAADLTTPLAESGVIYTNSANVNEINYTFKYSFENEKSYVVRLTYITNNLYTETLDYKFQILQFKIDTIAANIYTYLDNDEGRIRVDIKASNTEPYIGNFTIRRTSNESDFMIWEDVLTETLTDGNIIDYTWYDNTVKSGVWYKYGVQKRNARGDRGALVETKEPIMIILDDMYLAEYGKQLKIKFNPQISSYKHNVQETKTDTLGSQYPFIRRNGNMNYRSFSISGLISQFCDEQGLFTTKDDIYGNSKKLYEEYNYNNGISAHEDYVYEKLFRDKVTEFLYNGKIKLFRSPTEGNILVRLMDISLTPNQQLGRLIYEFSATAYEIDTPTFENYLKYDIQRTGEYRSCVLYTHDVLGQITKNWRNSPDVLAAVKAKHEPQVTSGFENTVNYLSYARLTFTSAPYLLIEDTKNNRVNIVTGSKYDDVTKMFYGYLIYVNEKPIVIMAQEPEYIWSGSTYNKVYQTTYEIKGEDVKITSLIIATTPYGGIDVQVDYVCSLSEKESTAGLANRLYNYKKTGQLWGTFQPEEEQYNVIFTKYFDKQNTYYQRLISINGMDIEAQPGTIVYVQEEEDTDYNRHIIGETGTLVFDHPIANFYFAGMHFDEASSAERDIIKSNEFVQIEGQIEYKTQIVNPIANGLYYILTENHRRQIYYQDAWHEISINNDIAIPVNAIVNYHCNVLKGEY